MVDMMHEFLRELIKDTAEKEELFISDFIIKHFKSCSSDFMSDFMVSKYNYTPYLYSITCKVCEQTEHLMITMKGLPHLPDPKLPDNLNYLYYFSRVNTNRQIYSNSRFQKIYTPQNKK